MNEKGQTLLEISVTIGVIMLIVAGLAVTTISGLKNSQLSKNQIQATKIAQETLTKVRVIKNLDYAVCGPTPAVKWSDLWSTTLPQCSLGPCNKYIFKDIGVMSCAGPSSLFWLEPQTTPEGLSSGFKRQIILEDSTDPNQKKVTVLVSWDDFSGQHQSQLVTILAKY